MFFSEKHYVSVKLRFENGNQFNWLNNNVYNTVIENTTIVYIFFFVQFDFQQKQKTISFRVGRRPHSVTVSIERKITESYRI